MQASQQERLFTPIFIKDILDIFKQASFDSGQSKKLFREEEVYQVLDTMQKMQVEKGIVNFKPIFELLDRECDAFSHQTKQNDHPFAKALRAIRQKIEAMEAFFVARKEQKQNTSTQGATYANLSGNTHGNLCDEGQPGAQAVEQNAADLKVIHPEAKEAVQEQKSPLDLEKLPPARLFPDFFMEKIREIFKKHSNDAGEAKESLLEPEPTREIQDALSALYIDSKGNITKSADNGKGYGSVDSASKQGNPEQKQEPLTPPSQEPYYYLLILIDKNKADYEKSKAGKGPSGKHYLGALTEVRNLVTHYFKETASSALQQIENERAQNKNSIWQHRGKKACLTVESSPYLIMTLLNTLTCNYIFTCCCNCCQRSPARVAQDGCSQFACIGLQKELSKGERSIFNPKTTVCQIWSECGDESAEIDTLQAAPVRQAMG